MNHFGSIILTLIVAAAVVTGAEAADHNELQPKWEFGLGMSALLQPDYLGADESNLFVLPVPYFRYRGEILQADRTGINGKIFSTERLQLGISGGGAFSVDSDDNDARRGMPDLDTRFELGPNLTWDIVNNKTTNTKLQLQLPVRGAFSLGDDFMEYLGLVINPRLHLRIPVGEWRYTASLGPIYRDRRYNAYTYSVAPQFATAERPAFDAESGQVAMRYSFDINRSFGNLYFGVFFRYFNLQGAANRNGPLFRQQENYSAGVIVSWVFARSDKLVSLGDTID